MGGLPADITEDEFRVFFEQFGEVVDSVVMFDRETHRSRGFGFVTFQSPEVANSLLNMGQGEGEAGVGAAETTTNSKGPRIGRLVMRGKTCEVKAAEPKESSRPSRRSQGDSSGATNRRFAEKVYPQGSLPPNAAHLGAYHDPHYMAGHHYPMVSPPYYPSYHPGIYHGGAGYHPGAMYAPVAHSADGLHHGYVPSGATPTDGAYVMDGANIAPYMEGSYEPGHAYAYGHPQMMQAAYPPHLGTHSYAPKPGPAGYPAPGTPSSVMHPAAPGLPTKDE